MLEEKLEERENPILKEKVVYHTQEKAGVKRKIKKEKELRHPPKKNPTVSKRKRGQHGRKENLLLWTRC